MTYGRVFSATSSIALTVDCDTSNLEKARAVDVLLYVEE